jgi:putative transcriptional regulator
MPIHPILGTRSLLIATPQLQDPHFQKSVVLILEHDEEGTVGVVLNRRSKVPCEQIVDQFDLPWPSPQEKLLIGGPVDPRSLWILHADGWAFEHTHLFEGVSVSRSEEALTGLCLGHEKRTRIYVGYAGWGPGQLENEIAEGSWWVGEAQPSLIFDVDVQEAWESALRTLGVEPMMLVEGPDEVH